MMDPKIIIALFLEMTEGDKDMLDFDLDLDQFANIKVIGVGGGGNNAVNRMINSGLKGVEFIAINTDAQALYLAQANNKIQIGAKLTKGLGSGGNPEIGQKAAEENRDEILQALKGSDMVLSPPAWEEAQAPARRPLWRKWPKNLARLRWGGSPSLHLEGRKRATQAETGIEDLKARVDTLITIPNDRLLQVIEKQTSIVEAFRIADDVLRQGVQGISDLIAVPGLINLDFADVKTIMRDTGSALMGIGIAKGDNRAAEAARGAISSPLLETSIEGARGVLLNITGGTSLGLFEVNEAADIIFQAADPEANIIFGAVIDEQMEDEVRVTVIATGFESKVHKKERPKTELEMKPFADIDKLDIPVFCEGNKNRPLFKGLFLAMYKMCMFRRCLYKRSLPAKIKMLEGPK